MGGGGREDQEPGRLGAGGHLGHLVRDGLEVLERRPEGAAVRGVFQGRVERGACHADRERPDAGAEEVQGVHGHPESPAGLTQHVVGAHRYTVEVQCPDGVRGQHVECLAGEPRPVGGHEEGGDATGSVALPRPGEDGVEVGLGGVGDPALLAGEPPAVTTGGRPCGEGEGSRVGPRARLAEREGGDGAAGAHLGEPARALGLGSRQADRTGSEALERERGLRLRAAARQRLAQQAEIERTRAEEPVQEPQSAERGDERAVDLARLALLGERAEFLTGECVQLFAPGGSTGIEENAVMAAPLLSRLIADR